MPMLNYSPGLVQPTQTLNDGTELSEIAPLLASFTQTIAHVMMLCCPFLLSSFPVVVVSFSSVSVHYSFDEYLYPRWHCQSPQSEHQLTGHWHHSFWTIIRGRW